MRYTRMKCFDSFRCTASACPDTCCSGWEIDLDAEILQAYRRLPGPLGEEIRSRISEADGYTFFQCGPDGRCPFLDEEGLCRLIAACGGQQSLLSEVCREHPRFHEEYGALRETCLAISCPEAARLLLESGPAELVQEEDSLLPPEEGPEELLLALLEDIREQLLETARARLPFTQRLRRLLAAALPLQAAVDHRMLPGGYGESMLQKARSALMGEECASPQAADDADALRPWLAAMTAMEFTDGRLQTLLQQALQEARQTLPEPVYPESLTVQLENLLVYFLYRNVLRAVWDEDLLGRIGLSVRLVQTAALLAGRQSDAPETAFDAQTLQAVAVLLSREVEHSDENLELLLNEVWAELLPGETE